MCDYEVELWIRFWLFSLDTVLRLAGQLVSYAFAFCIVANAGCLHDSISCTSFSVHGPGRRRDRAGSKHAGGSEHQPRISVRQPGEESSRASRYPACKVVLLGNSVRSIARLRLAAIGKPEVQRAHGRNCCLHVRCMGTTTRRRSLRPLCAGRGQDQPGAALYAGSLGGGAGGHDWGSVYITRRALPRRRSSPQLDNVVLPSKVASAALPPGPFTACRLPRPVHTSLGCSRPPQTSRRTRSLA